MDKSKKIFGNKVNTYVFLKACLSKQRFILKYGNDTKKIYHLKSVNNDILMPYMNVKNLVKSDVSLTLPNNAIIVGNIRMGFGHYRIAMAIASCANALGYVPYWLDLNSFCDTTASKIISYINNLYSAGSRLSQKYKWFDEFFWEPGSTNMYKNINQNAIDQKTSELMVRVFQDIPLDTMFIATHAWPAQAAIHAGLKNVVNIIPDNLPITLHLAEGAVHTVQTIESYNGYKSLKGMVNEKNHLPMHEDDILYAGHYVDHEIVSNIDHDCKKRIERIQKNLPIRFLFVIGGAGAGIKMVENMVISSAKYVVDNKVSMIINVGDHKNLLDELQSSLKEFASFITIHDDNFEHTQDFINDIEQNDLYGIHIFYHSNIFAAVYSTNLLMRQSDVMVTKPSELAFYPVPKLLTQRVGGHEKYGALRSSEIGDGTKECRTDTITLKTLNSLLANKNIIINMCENIQKNNLQHIYDGAYVAVKTVVNMKNTHLN